MFSLKPNHTGCHSTGYRNLIDGSKRTVTNKGVLASQTEAERFYNWGHKMSFLASYAKYHVL